MSNTNISVDGKFYYRFWDIKYRIKSLNNKVPLHKLRENANKTEKEKDIKTDQKILKSYI
jgi:hypothetical protein